MTRFSRTKSGLRIAYDTSGPVGGEPVILIHGGGQTRHAWRGTKARLAELGYHVMSLDQRGHGESDWAGRSGYCWENYAEDIRHMIRVHRVERPVCLVGASLGGISSLLAAAMEAGAGRASVSGIVLVDVTFKIRPEGAGRIRSFMTANPEGFESLEEAAEAIAAYRSGHRPRTDLSGLKKNLRLHRGRYYWHWDPNMFPEAGVTDSHQMILTRYPVNNVTCPVLLIKGSASDIVDDDGVADLKSRLPALQYEVVDRAGHMVVADENDAFHATIEKFLEGCVRQDARRS